MIAVHVRYKNSANLAGLEFAFQELVLGAFAAVKEPYLGSLGQAQGYA